MDFELFIGYPPDEDGPIVELTVRHDENRVSTPAVVSRRDGVDTVTVYAPAGEVARALPVNDFRAAIDHALELLDAPSSPA